MEFIKWGQKQVRQFALNLTETELKVEEATNNDAWGPHGTVMSEIAEEATDSEKYKEIMSVIARRLADTGENWRHVYKALLLLEHMVRHGPAKAARDTQANAVVLRDLQRFEFKDKNGRDQGINVRNRSKELLTLVSDQDKLTEAREVARVNRNKYRGASKEASKFAASGTTPVRLDQTFPKRVVYEEKSDHTADDEDPFEATRKRIEKLKANENQTVAPIKVNLPQQPKREPKKLSQVKMNPEIAATILKPQGVAVAENMPTQQKAIHQDLLGDLMLDLPSQQPEAIQRSEDSKSGVEDMFDVLVAPIPVSNEASAVVTADDWADFNDAPANNASKEISLTDLLAQETTGGVSAPMTMPVPVVSTPSTADPFANLCLTNKKQDRVPMGAGKAIPAVPLVQPQATQAAPQVGGFAVQQETPWTAQMMTQPTAKQAADPPLNASYALGIGMSGAVRQQGAPMNGNAIQPQSIGRRKQDPFANLGF